MRWWLIIALSTASSASAQVDPVPDTSSPRAMVMRFLDTCREGKFDLAANDLDIPPDQRERAQILARRLFLVLDQHLDPDVGKISRDPDGRLKDGLPKQVEEIGKVAGPNGAKEPIRLFKNSKGELAGRWVFSRGTYERIDAWYDQLGYRWILDHVPASLLGTGPMLLPWWQWIALAVMFAVSLFAGWLLSWPSRALLKLIARRTTTTDDDVLVARMRPPLALGWTLLVAYLIRGSVSFGPRVEPALDRILRIGFFVLFFWVLLRAITLVVQVMRHSHWAVKHNVVVALLPVGARIGKVLVIVMAVIAVLSELQYPVGSLVAGLGIGGLAFALAAQKTVENLFGAFSIGVDQPFREGDLVRIEDQVGTVESIGLRSTRVRTGERSAVSWPNGKLAEMRLESLSARDRLRVFARLRLALGTRSDVLRAILEQITAVLQAEEKLIKDAISVQLVELGEASIDVEVSAWLHAADGADLGRIRQELLFAIMGIVERSGAALAAKNAIKIESAAPPPAEAAETKS